MQTLFRTYLDIALWRKGPQDLTASMASVPVCALIALVYVIVAFVQVRFVHYTVVHSVALVLVDVVVQVAWLALVLVFFARIRRFPQTLSAVLGVGILLAALDLLVSSVLLFTGTNRDLGYEWALLKLVIMALAIGRILTHALDRGLFTCIGVVMGIVFSTHAMSRLVLSHL